MTATDGSPTQVRDGPAGALRLSPDRPAGRVAVVINAKAGTARVTDRRLLRERIAEAVAVVGELVETVFVEPRAWSRTLEALAAREDIDTVIVGGGDGSVSTAGAIFVGTGKAMGVIPLGTFNLFARSLKIPIGFDDALASLPHSTAAEVDVGELTDAAGDCRIFLHHVSIGFHPRFVEIRDAMPFASRFGKILASLRVWRRSLRSLARISLTIDGDVVRPRERYYQVAITVGSFREGFGDLPHAEDLTLGDLDLILLPARGRWDFIMAAFLVAIGRWRSNSHLTVTAVRRVTLTSRRDRVAVSMDGEVARRPTPLSVQVRPKALRVLKPAPGTSDEEVAVAIASPTVLR